MRELTDKEKVMAERLTAVMMPSIKDREYLERLKAEATTGDREADHWTADQIIVEILELYQLPLVAEWYKESCRNWWYA